MFFTIKALMSHRLQEVWWHDAQLTHCTLIDIRNRRAIVCSSRKEEEADLWPLSVTSRPVQRGDKIISPVCKWLCVLLFSQKASVVEDPQVSWDYLVLQHRSGRNIDPVAVIGDDDDGSLTTAQSLISWEENSTSRYSSKYLLNQLS